MYRDDGLAVFKNKSGPESEKIKKSIQSIFKENELKITIQCNLKIVDYLDVTFDLTDFSYHPFNKTNNEINYIHKQSNHPPSIIKQLPLSVKRCLSKLSSNQKIFNDSIPIYQEALIKAGYNHKLTYQKHHQKKGNSQQRKRQIIWFNPPYSKNVTTKVGKFCLNLIDRHFPPHHKLHKLFNGNNVKISYSCLPNIKSIINSHNYYYARHQLLVEELATASLYHNVSYNKSVSAITFYTKQILLAKYARIQKSKFTMVFAKQ